MSRTQPATFNDIKTAAARLEGHARRTPLLSSPFLDEIAERRVLVKAENLQHTGSFKFRGAWNAITALAPSGVVAFSSGNHAQGVALAAKIKGIPAVIIMPADAPAVKIENTRAYGAEVVLYDREKEDRAAIGERIARERGLTLVKPFDQFEVLEGQGTIGLEIAEQAGALGITKGEVLVPISGGGLAAGVALALEGAAPGLKLRTAEPEGFDDTARSLAKGEIVSNEKLSGSICDAILSPRPGDLTFPILHRLAGPGLVVSEEQVLRAMALAHERLKLVIEPGGAAALAAALFDPSLGDTVIAVASGGNVDRDIMARALAL